MAIYVPLGVIILGAVVMLFGVATAYENEGRAFLSGCLVAAFGLLMIMMIGV